MTNVQNNLKPLNVHLTILLLVLIHLPLSCRDLLDDQKTGMPVMNDDSADFKHIREILYQQEKDWNRGDIDAFMEAYWKSEELQFGGANGITRGWQNTLDRYKSAYPDRATMGKLSFQIKDMTRHSAEVVSLTGSWELERDNDRPAGHFLLIWRKIGGEWKITVDHTSQKNSP